MLPPSGDGFVLRLCCCCTTVVTYLVSYYNTPLYYYLTTVVCTMIRSYTCMIDASGHCSIVIPRTSHHDEGVAKGRHHTESKGELRTCSCHTYAHRATRTLSLSTNLLFVTHVDKDLRAKKIISSKIKINK